MSRRRRSASDLIEEEEESTTTHSSRKSRSIFRMLDEESEESSSTTHSHDRRMVSCYCSSCNGNLVDVCTKITYETEGDLDNNQDSEVVQEYNSLPSIEENQISFEEDLDDDGIIIQRMEIQKMEDDLLANLLHQQRSRRYVNQQTTITKQEILSE